MTFLGLGMTEWIAINLAIYLSIAVLLQLNFTKGRRQ